jgi:DNA-binding IclR family transcriptional regulator
MGLVRQARPILADIARKARESAFVAIARRDGVVPLEAAEPDDRVIRITPPIGHTLPLHCTASGKAHLAFDAEEQLQATLPEHLERFTAQTIIDRSALLEQLHGVARDGYSVDAGEYFEDVASVAVPVRDYTRSVVGSLAVAGPCYRIPADRINHELVPLIVEAGRELSYRLGYNE